MIRINHAGAYYVPDWAAKWWARLPDGTPCCTRGHKNARLAHEHGWKLWRPAKAPQPPQDESTPHPDTSASPQGRGEKLSGPHVHPVHLNSGQTYAPPGSINSQASAKRPPLDLMEFVRTLTPGPR